MMMNYLDMIYVMIPSGLLTSMSLWSDKIGDVRISLNDIYMVCLMTLWMIFFMSIINKMYSIMIVSLIMVIIVINLIRGQYFINRQKYYTSMIPHHSMAVMMSKRLLENEKRLTDSEKVFLEKLIRTQEDEIRWMKWQEKRVN